MARTLVIGIGLFVLSSFAGNVALAKAKTAKLTVTGPGITEPIELTEQSAISASVWGGNFIDKEMGAVEPPGSEIPRYSVQFHIKVRDGLRMVYVIYYAWDITKNRALVQIPDDEWRQLNHSAIIRCCPGKWFYATEPWGQTIRAALPP
jgi:hypothetical protein